MCGRYIISTDDKNAEIMEIIKQINKDLPLGEISPTDKAPVILENRLDAFGWGFPNLIKKSLIINARCETIIKKNVFKNCITNRRCIIPSTGFYEWKDNHKYHFTLPNNPVLYMAGIYNQFDNENRFLILTTKANKSMETIHNRMPVVLEKSMIYDWLNNYDIAMHLLQQEPPMLVHKLDENMISLF